MGKEAVEEEKRCVFKIWTVIMIKQFRLEATTGNFLVVVPGLA